MKFILFSIIAYLLCAEFKCAPTEQEPNNFQEGETFLLAAVEKGDDMPKKSFEVKPHETHIQNAPEDHIFHKTIVALPLSEVQPNTKILTNHLGEAVVAKPTDNSNEDLETAENIVFRPLFAYRRQSSQRRRYVPPSTTNCNCNRRRYTPQYSSYPYRYPNYYPNYYRNAQFPAIA